MLSPRLRNVVARTARETEVEPHALEDWLRNKQINSVLALSVIYDTPELFTDGLTNDGLQTATTALWHAANEEADIIAAAIARITRTAAKHNLASSNDTSKTTQLSSTTIGTLTARVQ